MAADPRSVTKVVVPGAHDMVSLLGQRDELLRVIEKALSSDIHVRGNEITLTGDEAENELGAKLFAELIALLESGDVLDGPKVERSLAMLRGLHQAGFDSVVREDIRWNVWLQLWGNICFSPISALTCTTLDRITTETGLRALCKAMMAEAQAVNEAHGIHIPSEMADRRLAAAASTIGHKMSMLQDLECGRSMEIDPIERSCKNWDG